MAKRFPIPEFDYSELKGRRWHAPSALSSADAAALLERAHGGDETVYGAHAVNAEDAFFDALDVRGAHRSAWLCLCPPEGVTLSGRSHAWKRQRVVMIAGLPDPSERPCIAWATPRPMNTRLGPENGIAAPAGALTLVFGHMFSDHWIANRVSVDDEYRPPTGKGFRLISSDDDESEDFHCAVVTFTWPG